MARTVQQIQNDLDTLNAAKANPALSARKSDGSMVTYRSMDELLKAITATEAELRKALGQTGSRTGLAQHKRGDGPTGPSPYYWENW